MQRAFQLASLGRGHVSPNPVVGCVVVHQNRIIGEGWHQQYGQAHAEVNAIQAVQDKSLIAESIVFVSLEPCSHFGKTPPCADLLIQHKPRKVVVANLDPNPLVAGKGIEKLRKAGIDVEIGLLATEGRWLNRFFFTNIEQHRPYVILKWAETVDGFVAHTDGSGVAISNEFSQLHSHRWRTEVDAILVGTNTAQNDNPQLTARHWQGKNPVRLVIDRNLRLPKNLHLFDGNVKTLVYNQLIFSNQPSVVEQVMIDFDRNIVKQILKDLQQRNIQTVLVEGGTQTLQSWLDSGYFDEIRIFKSPKMLGEGIKSPVLPTHLIMHEETQIGGDTLRIFLRKN